MVYEAQSFGSGSYTELRADEEERVTFLLADGHIDYLCPQGIVPYSAYIASINLIWRVISNGNNKKEGICLEQKSFRGIPEVVVWVDLTKIHCILVYEIAKQ